MKNVTLVATFYNEIYFLPSFLDGIKDVFFECIFVDGGEDGSSTDGSISMIKESGYKVHHREFNYNWADMKNFGLGLIKTKWRMVLDIDEIMSQGMKKFITEFNETNPSSNYCVSFFRDTYMDGGVIDAAPLDFPIRLFDEKVFYRSPSDTVHEQVIIHPTTQIQKFWGGRLFHRKDSYRQAKNNLINELVLRGERKIPKNRGLFWNSELNKAQFVELIPEGRKVVWLEEYLEGPYLNK